LIQVEYDINRESRTSKAGFARQSRFRCHQPQGSCPVRQGASILDERISPLFRACRGTFELRQAQKEALSRLSGFIKLSGNHIVEFAARFSMQNFAKIALIVVQFS